MSTIRRGRFLPSNKDFAKIHDDLSHNTCQCLMNLDEIPRFPQVSLYIYIWMFPHGSLPRRAETYATLLETKLPPLQREEKKFSSSFDPVRKRVGDGCYSWYIIHDSFSRDVTWTLCNFPPPWRSNLRGQVVRGIDTNLLRDTVSLHFITDARCNK